MSSSVASTAASVDGGGEVIHTDHFFQCVRIIHLMTCAIAVPLYPCSTPCVYCSHGMNEAIFFCRNVHASHNIRDISTSHPSTLSTTFIRRLVVLSSFSTPYIPPVYFVISSMKNFASCMLCSFFVFKQSVRRTTSIVSWLQLSRRVQCSSRRGISEWTI